MRTVKNETPKAHLFNKYWHKNQPYVKKEVCITQIRKVYHIVLSCHIQTISFLICFNRSMSALKRCKLYIVQYLYESIKYSEPTGNIFLIVFLIIFNRVSWFFLQLFALHYFTIKYYSSYTISCFVTYENPVI